MMHENVTKTYKKCNTNKSNSINFKAKHIACKLKIDDRVQKLLDRVNNTMLKKNKVNQWKNTSSVIECCFLVFDIGSFYLSISTKLFDEAMSFAKLYYDFTSDELEIIMHFRKTLLFWQDSTWVKKEGDEDFDIPM